MIVRDSLNISIFHVFIDYNVIMTINRVKLADKVLDKY